MPAKVMVLTRRGDCIDSDPSALKVSETENNQIQIVAGAESDGPITLVFTNRPKLELIFKTPPPENVVIHPNPSDPSVAGLKAQKEITMTLNPQIKFASGKRLTVRTDGKKKFSNTFEPHAITYTFSTIPAADCNPHHHEDWHIEC